MQNIKYDIRNKWWFAIVYMFVVTAFFSSIVIGFSRFTRERVEANRALAFEKAVLVVLPGLYDDKATALELHRWFIQRLSVPDALSGDAYTLREGKQIVAYALPVSGQGFWAPIKGVIGIAADKRTITGIDFYEQSETPGLGAEITAAAFRSQFKGKRISTVGRPINIKRPGEVLGPSDVHAVTGATQTSARVQDIINTALSNWRSQMLEGSGQR